MESSEIEVFLVLAEELHFGRTAERLRLSPSRVSRLVASLERRVGGPLLERTSRRVTLTALGKQFRADAQPAWSGLEAAFAAARDTARSIDGTLRLGWTVTVGGPAVSLLTQTFSLRFPGCELAIYDLPVVSPYELLQRGVIDVMVFWLVLDEPGLTAGPVIEYRDRVLAVGRGHRLASLESVCVEDLGDEKIHDARGQPVALIDALMPRRTPSGRNIPRVVPFRGFEDLLALIAGGRMVHPTVSGVPVFNRDDIRLVPIRDLPPIPLGLIWRTADENARVRALADIARTIGPPPAAQRQAARGTSVPQESAARH